MTNLQWSAACSFFSVPLSIYLTCANKSDESSWQVIKESKKWSEAELKSHQDNFLKEWQYVDPQCVLTWHDKNYPSLLRRLFAPPVCLYFSGDLRILQNKNVAVVGSRHPSSLYLDWMNHELGLFLSEHNLVVVSGGTIGVDQARIHAHSIAPPAILYCCSAKWNAATLSKKY